MDQQIKEFYTLEQLSQELGITIYSLRNFIKEKKLKASNVANKYVIQRDDIIEWLNNNKN